MDRDAIEWFKAVKYSNINYITKHLDEMYDARDENGNTGLMHAAFYGNVAVVQLLVEKSARLLNLARKTALMQCVCSDYNLGRASIPDIVNILRRLEAGISDERGCTALMMAAERGDVRSVAALVEYEHGQKDSRGRTALMYAASFGKAECIPALLVETAEIDNKGMTALMFAAYGNNVPIIRQLVRYEARRKNKNNETALIIAIRQGREDAVSELAAHEKDIYYGSISPYQFAINSQQLVSADILRPHNMPIPTFMSTNRPLQGSTVTEKTSAGEGALELTTRPNLQQSDQNEALENIQLHINTLRQKVDAIIIEMTRPTHSSTHTASLNTDSSQKDILFQRQLAEQDKVIAQLKAALERSQMEIQALTDSHATLMKRIAEAERSAAGAQIQLALGAAGEQTNSDLIGHLGILSESISSIDTKNREEHRDFAAKLGSLHANLTQAVQVSSSQAEEIASLRDRLTCLQEEVLKLSVNTHDAATKISGYSKALEMKLLNLEARLGQSNASSFPAGHAYTESSISRAINHLHEELQVIKRSIENVSQTLVTSHGITIQNLDALSSTHSMFVANYPIHKSIQNETKLFEELQNKIVRIEHYMEDMMREDRLSAIMTGFIELNSRVDQLVIDQAKSHTANLPGRVDEVERTLDAILTVLNLAPEEAS
ncbi:Hypothetical protein GLP15_1527 [Giardia lamblia P15]|uniref:Uncharacterized protein n=1 Tax=Giardia intestinalis (strain P15) TaxID=658858 RepID=E1EYL4_GIAIA|nr:Hypothetical protein GLP15_1527 [Giardia lamblia P15]